MPLVHISYKSYKSSVNAQRREQQMRHRHMIGSMNNGTAYCQCLLHNGDVIQREGKSIWPMQQAID